MVTFNLGLYTVGALKPVFNAFVVVGIFFSSPNSLPLIFLLTSALVLTVRLTLRVQTKRL